MTIIVTIFPTYLVINSFLSFSCPFLQKQESGFHQVGSLVMRNISAKFKAIPNYIDFYKGIFLHVIPVCIVDP